MTTPVYHRPGPGETAPYHALYVDKVPTGNLLTLYAAQLAEVEKLLRPLSDAKAATAYAPGKWTIKEVIGHLSDAERVFSYRAMRAARADATPLPGFDENAWVPPGRFNDRTLASLLDEWVAVRKASIALFTDLPQESVTRKGQASGYDVSVQGVAYVIHGHVAHHLGVLRERYL